MATNYVRDEDVITLVAPAALKSGQAAMVGNIFGVAVRALASGESGGFVTSGIWTLPKNSAEAWTVGSLLYWDPVNAVCTTSANDGGSPPTAYALIGVATAVAANPSATGNIRLNGAFH